MINYRKKARKIACSMSFSSAKIKLRTCVKGGRTFGAGPCIVRIGGVDLGPSFAVKSGREKRILPPDAAVKWLTERKCPNWLAVALVKGED